MKWLAPSVIGVAALLGGLGFGPILGRDPSDPNLVPDNPYAPLLAVAIYGTVFMVILGVIAVSLRRLAVSARARAWQTERALGGTMRRVVGSEALLGLRHGVLVSGALVLSGAAARQALPWLDGQDHFRDRHFQPWMVAILALIFTMCAATTVAVYVIATLAAVGAADASHAVPTSVRPARSPGRGRRAVRVALIGVFALSTAALVWQRIFPEGRGSAINQAAKATDYWWATTAVMIFALSCTVLVTGAVAALADLLSRATGRALLSRGHGALLQAGDALARPSTERRIALGTMAIVVGLVTWISGASDISAARHQIADHLGPLAIITPSSLAHQEAQSAVPPQGYPEATLDPALVTNLEKDDRLVAVPFAYLRAETQVTEGFAASTCGGSPCDAYTWPVETYVVVDSGDLTQVSPDGLRPLGLVPGVTIQAGVALVSDPVWGSPGPTWLTVDGTRYPIYRSALDVPGNVFIDTTWAGSRFVWCR